MVIQAVRMLLVRLQCHEVDHVFVRNLGGLIRARTMCRAGSGRL